MTIESNHAPRVQGSGRAYLLLTTTALCWGANAVFGRLAVGEISPMALVAMRWLGALGLLLMFARAPVRRDWPDIRKRLPFVAAMGAIGFTAFNALYYVAAHSTTAVNIGIIQGAVPMMVLIGAFAAYRTRVRGVQIAGVLVTMLGVAIVASAGELARLATFTLNFGDLLMIAACALYAGYTVGLNRRPPVSSLALFTVMAGAAFLTSLPLVLAEAALGRFQWPTPDGWLVLALVTVFPSFLAQICFIQGVSLIGPGRAGDLRQPGAGVRIDPGGARPQGGLRAIPGRGARPGPRRHLAVRARQGFLRTLPRCHADLARLPEHVSRVTRPNSARLNHASTREGERGQLAVALPDVA